MKKKKSILLIFVSFFLVGYHAFNALKGQWPEFPTWKEKQIHLRWGDKAQFNIISPFLEMDLQRIDASSRWLSGVGYVGRFLLGQTPHRVLQSKAGHPFRLYFRENLFFQFPESIQRLPPQLGSYLSKVSSVLEKSGVELVVLPIPTKVSMERGLLPKELPGDDPYVRQEISYALGRAKESPKAFYGEMIRGLSSAVDLYDRFRQFCWQGTACPLYLPLDHHWSSLGISETVLATLETLKSRGWQISNVQRVQERISGENFDHFLLREFLLPKPFLRTRAEFNEREPFFRVKACLAKRVGRIFVAGTSFASRLRGTGFSFGELIGGALGIPVFDFSYENAGLVGAMKSLLRENHRLGRGDVLIWEFPLSDTFGGLPGLDPSDLVVQPLVSFLK